MHAAGLNNTDLRHLLSLGLATHGLEQARRDSPHRQFRPMTSLSLPRGSCFVLTDKGIEAATQLASAQARGRDGSFHGYCGTTVLAILPTWDRDRRQLHWNSQLVKHFTVPAPCQEPVLQAFHEQRWSRRIDDSLPGVPHIDAKVRLHDAIKALNQRQVHRLLAFRGDGTGKGVIWELATAEETSPNE